ncbi:MAG: NUDIX hydrolase [Anaerolineae bacterium]|nr:NUDIX hydrolase [Anaerolineae bacterium]
MAHWKTLYCSNCGAPVVSRELFGRERETCPACGWIHFEDPKVAAAVLVEGPQGVLLVQRGNPPEQGLWTVPAGFIDAHEDPARAAERECLEETGLVVRVTRLLGLIAGREHPAGADMVAAYHAEITGGALRAGDDAMQAAFFDRSALPPLAFHATRVILGLEKDDLFPA